LLTAAQFTYANYCFLSNTRLCVLQNKERINKLIVYLCSKQGLDKIKACTQPKKTCVKLSSSKSNVNTRPAGSHPELAKAATQALKT